MVAALAATRPQSLLATSTRTADGPPGVRVHAARPARWPMTSTGPVTLATTSTRPDGRGDGDLHLERERVTGQRLLGQRDGRCSG